MFRLIRNDFIFDDPIPVPECHASTILKTGENRFVAAWFGGSKEANPDVMIWSSYYRDNQWSKPRCITTETGIQHWNPVLLQLDETRIRLFYKLGFPIAEWKTFMLESVDEGENWTYLGEMVPGDISGGRGPVKNKVIRTSNGRILAPGSTENLPWRCFVDVSDDQGVTWEKSNIPLIGPHSNDFNLIQPSLWESDPGIIHAFIRSNRGCIYRSDSNDNGLTWCNAYVTEMPNNNSGLDCVYTENGHLILVCNPIGLNWGDRTPLSVFISDDNGVTFTKLLDLVDKDQKGEYSYPAVITDHRHIYITYTWQRKKICFAEIEEC